jgi:hypothetical protein
VEGIRLCFDCNIILIFSEVILDLNEIDFTYLATTIGNFMKVFDILHDNFVKNIKFNHDKDVRDFRKTGFASEVCNNCSAHREKIKIKHLI